MRNIQVHKYTVNANFPGYYYPIFSLVILRENDRNTMGRIIGYSGNDKVIIQSKAGKRHKLKYSDVVFYEDPHQPVMTLKEVERLARKYINYYSDESNLVKVDGDEYLIDNKVQIIFDTDQIYDHPGGVMAVCLLEDYSAYEFNVLLPFIQYAKKNQIKKLLLHEVAHLLAKPYHGHDDLWYDICKTIGGDTREVVPVSEIVLAQIREIKRPPGWVDTYEGIDVKLWEKLAHLSYESNLARMGLVLDETDVISDLGYYGSAHDMGIDFESDLRWFEHLDMINQDVGAKDPLYILNVLDKYVAELIKLGANKDNRDKLNEDDSAFVVRSLVKLKRIQSILNSDFRDLID